MKANSNFRDQVGQVTSWFKEWSECEQTVALYSLLKKLSPAQAKFLDQVLQQSLADCTDVMQLQKKANDEVFVAGLCGEDKGKVILQLLQLLPLLQAGNEKAKAEYLKLIPEVLSHTIENGVNIEESRQLLSYSLIHPAITQEERSKFRMWLGYLEERFTYSISHTRPSATAPEGLAPAVAPISASQEGLNNLQGAGGPSLPMGNGWHGQGHAAHYGMDGGGVSGSGSGDGGTVGSGLLSNGHYVLRTTNSHAGVFSVPNGHHLPLQATSSAPPNFETLSTSVSQGISSQPNMHTRLHRTTSIVHSTPLPLRVQNPEKTVTDWLQMHSSVTGGPGGLAIGRGRSPSFTEHAPLSPQSSVTSSGSGGSDSHHDDGPQPVRDSFLEEGSGMREVPVWLKTLRLHKYSYLFRQMTYEEMLDITEEWLEAQKVTKGARHKIVISIQKLRERQQVLRDFEKSIMEGGSIKEVLGEMKNMLNTPIKAYNMAHSGAASTTPGTSPFSPPPSPDSEIVEGNLPGQFCRLMGKVCTQLLTASIPDDESIQLYFQLIDKCLNHEAFSQRQKSLLSSWKQQAQKIWQPPSHKFDRRQKGWGNTFPMGNAVTIRGGGSRSRLTPGQTGVQQWSFGSRRSVLGSAAVHTPLQRNSSLNTSILNKPGLLEAKQPVTRTQSAPLRSSHLTLTMQSTGTEPATDTEINASLDSLCLRMTEHAIGSLDGSDKGSTF